jgi:cobalt-zinc-cadmium efflux system outer membrane protein
MKRTRAAALAIGALAVAVIFPTHGAGQQSLSWDEVKVRFLANNPVLGADAVSVEEMKAGEITAYLRPNPQYTISTDGTQLTPHNGTWRPTSSTQLQNQVTYLHERERKRELRQESAKQGTLIAGSEHDDLKRNLLFNLRTAFIATLQAKRIYELSKADLEHYDKIIEISRARFKDGDLAQIDLDRIELLRVQYESEMQTAIVNLRTSKIQLLQLLNDRTPVDQFDVLGLFDWRTDIDTLDNYHKVALDNRPDLAAALETIQQSHTNYKLAKANGSTDPTIGLWETYNPSFNNPDAVNTLGLSVNVPLRFFDRNQGEKKRTLLDIDRSRKSADAAQAQVFGDVDSSYEQVRSNIELLKPYKEKYNDQALRVRDTVTYSYQHGGASLMDFLNAQSDFRTVQLAYVQLVGAYLTAAAQLNMAVGREVIQ